MDRYTFYERTRAYLAATPDVLRVDEEHLREGLVPNCGGIVLTRNHKVDRPFLPADDQRHYVAWSNTTPEISRRTD